MNTWDDLTYWSSPEWRIVQDRLSKCKFNPRQENLFNALDAVPLVEVKVAILGQDPYPDPRMATGIAFSIPEDIVGFPPTLETIFKEYQDDLGLPKPTHGSLNYWCSQGVLLWNVIPSCEQLKSLSHDWYEWRVLTNQMVEALCKEGVVFVLLGAKARGFREIINYYELVSPGENILIELCHPSPRANASSKAKFLGSRIFSTINDSLAALGRYHINWRL